MHHSSFITHGTRRHSRYQLKCVCCSTESGRGNAGTCVTTQQYKRSFTVPPFSAPAIGCSLVKRFHSFSSHLHLVSRSQDESNLRSLTLALSPTCSFLVEHPTLFLPRWLHTLSRLPRSLHCFAHCTCSVTLVTMNAVRMLTLAAVAGRYYSTLPIYHPHDTFLHAHAQMELGS